MGSVNWKKVLLFGTMGALISPASAWLECMKTGGHCPFTAGTILVPAVPALIAVFTALFSNPWKRQ